LEASEKAHSRFRGGPLYFQKQGGDQVPTGSAGYPGRNPFGPARVGADGVRKGVVPTEVISLLTAVIYLLKALVEFRAACCREEKKKR